MAEEDKKIPTWDEVEKDNKPDAAAVPTWESVGYKDETLKPQADTDIERKGRESFASKHPILTGAARGLTTLGGMIPESSHWTDYIPGVGVAAGIKHPEVFGEMGQGLLEAQKSRFEKAGEAGNEAQRQGFSLKGANNALNAVTYAAEGAVPVIGPWLGGLGDELEHGLRNRNTPEGKEEIAHAVSSAGIGGTLSNLHPRGAGTAEAVGKTIGEKIAPAIPEIAVNPRRVIGRTYEQPLWAIEPGDGRGTVVAHDLEQANSILKNDKMATIDWENSVIPPKRFTPSVRGALDVGTGIAGSIAGGVVGGPLGAVIGAGSGGFLGHFGVPDILERVGPGPEIPTDPYAKEPWNMTRMPKNIEEARRTQQQVKLTNKLGSEQERQAERQEDYNNRTDSQQQSIQHRAELHEQALRNATARAEREELRTAAERTKQQGGGPGGAAPVGAPRPEPNAPTPVGGAAAPPVESNPFAKKPSVAGVVEEALGLREPNTLKAELPKAPAGQPFFTPKNTPEVRTTPFEKEAPRNPFEETKPPTEEEARAARGAEHAKWDHVSNQTGDTNIRQMLIDSGYDVGDKIVSDKKGLGEGAIRRKDAIAELEKRGIKPPEKTAGEHGTSSEKGQTFGNKGVASTKVVPP